MASHKPPNKPLNPTHDSLITAIRAHTSLTLPAPPRPSHLHLLDEFRPRIRQYQILDMALRLIKHMRAEQSRYRTRVACIYLLFLLISMPR